MKINFGGVYQKRKSEVSDLGKESTKCVNTVFSEHFVVMSLVP